MKERPGTIFEAEDGSDHTTRIGAARVDFLDGLRAWERDYEGRVDPFSLSLITSDVDLRALVVQFVKDSGLGGTP